MTKSRFDKAMEKSIDGFVESFHMATSDRERLKTNVECFRYIESACKNKGYDPKPYKDQYIDRVRGD